MTSLPIYWEETAEFGDLLAADRAPHWVRDVLERDYDLVPLDSLSAPETGEPGAALSRLEKVALLQPRALSPAEFAALDRWVNDGGKLLLFADPMLTEHSEFALGDKRRPEAIAMLSPILARWGLVQFFDEGQPAGQRQIAFAGVQIDVEEAGYFELLPGRQANCNIKAQGLIADCVIGKGTVLLVADAALINADNGSAGAMRAMQSLLSAAFGPK